MSVTVPLRKVRSNRLLPAPVEPLALVVRGGEHDGCEIRLRAAKCTIGSAPGCTLRLRSPGVSPLACWILRGPGGTVVRRRASDTQLNGGAFRDAPLAPGDCLRIGSVKLEVLSCSVAPAVASEPSREEPLLDEQRAELEQTARTSAATASRLQAELTSIEQSSSRQLLELTDQVQRLGTERDVAQAAAAQAAAERAAAAQVAANVETARQLAWLEERDRLEARCGDLSRQLECQRTELETLRAEQSQRNLAPPVEAPPVAAQMTISMEQIRREADEEQAELRRERDDLAVEHQTLRTSFADLTRQLREAQVAQQELDRTSTAQAELQALAHERLARIEQLEQQLARTAADQSVQATEQLVQLAAEREALATAQRKLAAEREALAAAQATFAMERSQASELAASKEQVLNRQASELSDRLEQSSEKARQLDERQCQLDAREAELAARQTEFDEVETRLRARHAQLQEQQAELEALGGQLDERQAQLEQRQLQLDEAATRGVAGETRREQAEVVEPAAEKTLVVSGPAAEPVRESGNVESVLDRLVKAGLWRGDDESTAAAEPAAVAPSAEPIQPSPEDPVARGSDDLDPVPADSQDGVAEIPAAPEPLADDSPVAPPPPFEKPVWTDRPVANAGGDDESIESYMDRLLKRVRGDAHGAGGAAEKPASRYVPAVPAPAPLPQTKPVTPVEPVKAEEYIPRCQAPEQGVNLAAMRELANSAARSAIQSHASRRGGKTARGRLLGSGASLVVGAFAGIFAILQGSWLLGGCSALALVAAAYCGMNGLRSAFDSLRLGRPSESAKTQSAAEPADEQN
ncbi:MAG: hypothetical protein SFU86_08405 [Pirellulaceae bacterium]|nr:hypothetical protein [Pirellulaceae bacterium]